MFSFKTFNIMKCCANFFISVKYIYFVIFFRNLVGVSQRRRRRSVNGNLTVEDVLHASLTRFPLLGDL